MLFHIVSLEKCILINVQSVQDNILGMTFILEVPTHDEDENLEEKGDER